MTRNDRPYDPTGDMWTTADLRWLRENMIEQRRARVEFRPAGTETWDDAKPYDPSWHGAEPNTVADILRDAGFDVRMTDASGEWVHLS